MPDEPILQPAPIRPAAIAVATASTLPSLACSAPLDALRANPRRFGFFQAVRLLYRSLGLPARPGASRPDRVRFIVSASLAFPPAEIHCLDAGEDTVPWTMAVNFMGLTGPSGVLPRHYTEWLIARRHARDPGTRDFLDLFNHRLVGLFWQAWAKYRIEIAHEFETGRGILRHVFDLIGVGTPTLYAWTAPRHRASDGTTSAQTSRTLPGAAMGYYSGLIAQRPHGVGALGQVVSDITGAPAHVTGCLGTWQKIPRADRTRLAGGGNRLGEGCVLGSAFWDRQTTLEIRIGPLNRRRFDALLPHRKLLSDLVELLRFLTGIALDIRIRLSLHAEDVPLARIAAPPAGPGNTSPRGAHAARLGWNVWLCGRHLPHPANECHFNFSAMGDESWL